VCRLIYLAALAVVFLLAMSGLAFADVWSDISDATWQNVYHVSATDAATVADGYPDGTFRPNQSVTRGQFAKMVADGLGIPLYDPAVPSFSDVPTDHIFYEYIEGAVDFGVISGYPDGTYRPNNNIVRQQTNSILGKWLSQEETDAIGGIQGADGFYDTLAAWYTAEGEDVLAGFADRAQISPVHRPGTAYLVMRGVVLGSPSGGATYLGPLSELSRVQAVAMIVRTRDVEFEAEPPTVTEVDPAAGPAGGGNSVVITGTGFGGLSGADAVTFGAHNATSYVVNSPTQITAVAPAGTAGTTVDVRVTTPAGSSAVSTAGKYSYGVPTVTLLNPVAGAAEGGNSVVITGTGFTGVTAVKFGLVAATSYVVNSPTQITAVAPAGTAGTTVDVTVTTPAGTSATSGSDNDYAYGVPTVTALDPDTGTTLGGTLVTITGTSFVEGATVSFGSGNPATDVIVVNATTITCLSPPHEVGVVDVTVTTPAGTSAAAGTGNDYTYLLNTADVAFALTSPAPGGGNSITGGGAVRTVEVKVVNATTSVVLTGTKLTGQAVVIGGADHAAVIATGTGTAPVFTINTSSVAVAGGSKVFTLTVNETGKAAIVYTVTVTVAPPFTADMVLALTTPAADANNTIDVTGSGGTRTVAVDVVNATASVVLTGTKLASQTVAIGGTNAANVTAGGSVTFPTYTVNTTSVAVAGGSKVFTLTVSETGKADVVYTVTVTVAGATADMALALTTPAPGGGNSITGGGAVRTVAVNVVNTTASVVLTGTKLASQTVAVGGTNAANVTAGGTPTAPTYAVDTSSVAVAGGSRVFTLTVSETGKANIVYTVTVTVAPPLTDDIGLALTTPAADVDNTINVTGSGGTRTVAVDVVNATASVVLTGTKLASQTVAIGGANAANVTAGGSTTLPTYTVNTTSVAAAGGSKVFTLTVSETGKADVVYTVTVTVAAPFTADILLALTTPAADANNTINVTGSGGTRTVAVNVVNATASVVLTGTKLAGQAVVIGGADAAAVIATGTGTAPIYTIDTSSVAAAGGSKVFTLTVSETGKIDVVYTVTVTVAGL